jgi:hypothetical protein
MVHANGSQASRRQVCQQSTTIVLVTFGAATIENNTPAAKMKATLVLLFASAVLCSLVYTASARASIPIVDPTEALKDQTQYQVGARFLHHSLFIAFCADHLLYSGAGIYDITGPAGT